jgi:hypothetical protein
MRSKLPLSALIGAVQYSLVILKGLMCDARTVHKLHFIILISVVTYRLRSDITGMEMFLAGRLVIL